MQKHNMTYLEMLLTADSLRIFRKCSELRNWFINIIFNYKSLEQKYKKMFSKFLFLNSVSLLILHMEEYMASFSKH